MTAEQNFDPLQRELYDLMSEISETCYSAGWISGNEYAIWAAVQTGDPSFGRGMMDAPSLARCLELSVETGGWIQWVDDSTNPGMPPEHWGPRFVPMDVWLEMAACPGVWSCR